MERCVYDITVVLSLDEGQLRWLLERGAARGKSIPEMVAYFLEMEHSLDVMEAESRRQSLFHDAPPFDSEAPLMTDHLEPAIEPRTIVDANGQQWDFSRNPAEPMI